jgi:phosphate transport system protein
LLPGQERILAVTTAASHFEALLQRDIDSIRGKLLQMATLTAKALTRAYQALKDHDRQLAYAVILHDQDIDTAELELDRLCMEFIIRHQPAAGHLRFVYSASKIVNELERVGDYAESIARQVLLLDSDDVLASDLAASKFKEISELAIPMVQQSVRAFVEKNADLAMATKAIEPLVNDARDSLNAELVQLREEGRLSLDALPALLTVARRFERVSDQATNICEQALYFATGENVRHTPVAGFRVVFVDDANECLSQMAEAIARSMNASQFTFSSAGIKAGNVDPRLVPFLKEKGIDASGQTAKAVEPVPQSARMQVVVMLSETAFKAFPRKPGRKLGLLWSVSDPSQAQGTPEEIHAIYEQAYSTLKDHIADLIEAIEGYQRNQG